MPGKLLLQDPSQDDGGLGQDESHRGTFGDYSERALAGCRSSPFPPLAGVVKPSFTQADVFQTVRKHPPTAPPIKPGNTIKSVSAVCNNKQGGRWPPCLCT